QPLYVQYGRYLGQLAQGDLGQSLKTQSPVWSEFKALFPATLELALCALLLALVLGLIAGVLAAVKRGSWLDHTVMTGALTGYSMPIFWWGLLLILIFSVGLGWTPVSGRLDLMFDVEPRTGFMLIDAWLAERADPELNSGALWDAVRHLILPAIVLGTIPLAVIARMTRSSMLEVLREDYVRTARAKGLSPMRVIFVHTLRNALIPVLTVVGLQVGTLMGGAVLTETIFSWPGIGKWLIDAIGRRDYPVVQNGILLVATLVVVTNFIVDLLYGVANPRIRVQA
ncbi:MAG: peptide ABC transporter permease, partial [Burkholderiales bacterium RIFCSPLOWO2_12_FULL_67_210]